MVEHLTHKPYTYFMKQRICLLSLLMLAVLPLLAEKTDAMLFGDVKAVRTSEHLPYVTLTVRGTTLATTTDASGHFKLAHLPLGNQTIVVTGIGYKTQVVEVEMKRGQPTECFILLEDDPLNLQQVVVTGTRTKHLMRDVPIRTELISAKTIEVKNASNLFQALEGTPGVRVENQCQACNFTMVRMQGLGAEHTQVMVNGQPLYSGLAGVYGLEQVATTDIGQIEVIKGAGSALYGSSAVAGAINIVTKEPSSVPETTVDVQMGSFNTNRYALSSSMRNEKGNIGLQLYAQRNTADVIDVTGEGQDAATVRKADGISDRVESRLNNMGFSLYIDNPFWGNDKLVLRGKSVYERRAGGILGDDYYRNPLTDGTENIVTDRYEAELQYTKPLNAFSELRFMVGYVNHNREATNDSYLGDYLSTHGDTAPDVRGMRPYLANEHTVTSTLTYSLTKGRHALLFGVQGYHDNLTESGMYVVVNEASPYYGLDYRSMSYKHATEFGAFVQDEWAVAPGWVLVPSVRFDKHRSGERYESDRQVFASENFPETAFDQTSVNPRLAVKYEVSNNLTLRLNAGTGFRAPYGFSEDLHLCSGSPRVWKSSDLNPERSVSVNLSADYYGDRMRVSANVFRTNLKDKIGFTDADAAVAAMGYDYQWRNIDDAYVQGLELSTMLSYVKDLDLGLDLVFNQGAYINERADWVGTPYAGISKQISRLPSVTGNATLDYSPGNWQFSLIGNYQGRLFIDYYSEDPTKSKIKETNPFALLNARVSHSWNGLRFYAGVNNLMGYTQTERYLDDAAFIYAPLYGTLGYAGVAITLRR